MSDIIPPRSSVYLNTEDLHIGTDAAGNTWVHVPGRAVTMEDLRATVALSFVAAGWTNEAPTEVGIYLWSDGKRIGLLEVQDQGFLGRDYIAKWPYGDEDSTVIERWTGDEWRSMRPIKPPQPLPVHGL